MASYCEEHQYAVVELFTPTTLPLKIIVNRKHHAIWLYAHSPLPTNSPQIPTL